MLIDPYYDTDIIPINDNLYVYLNGTRRFVGGTNYEAPNGGTNGRSNIANETDGWYIPGGVTITGFRQGINVLDIIAEERARWGGMGYLVLRLGPRGLSPDGRIVAPSDGTTIGPSTLMITAEAWDRSGSGLKQVEFDVFYDGVWHNAGVDQTSPYQTTWQTPNQLHSQLLRFAVHVLDNSGNKAMYAGGARTVNYIESIDNSGTSENWVPFRTYLNQRSLTPEGDSKCSVASMAMIFAMNGVISADYNSLRDKANEMYPRVLVNGTAYVNKMTEELTRQGVSASFSPGPIDQGQGWQTIRQEIDAGRPVIVRTTHGVVTSQGHFIVAVGYREVNETRQIIAYDPFGKWNGTCCIDNYDTNSTDPESRKGRWVYYDFNRVFGATNWLITARPSNQGARLIRDANASLTSPDSTSDEPETIGTYIGVKTGVSRQVFLPLIKR